MSQNEQTAVCGKQPGHEKARFSSHLRELDLLNGLEGDVPLQRM